MNIFTHLVARMGEPHQGIATGDALVSLELPGAQSQRSGLLVANLSAQNSLYLLFTSGEELTPAFTPGDFDVIIPPRSQAYVSITRSVAAFAYNDSGTNAESAFRARDIMS